MHKVVVRLELQRLQNLNGEASDQVLRDSLEVVLFEEIVQVDREQLEGDDQVLAEDHVVLHAYNVVLVVGVGTVQEFEDL